MSKKKKRESLLHCAYVHLLYCRTTGGCHGNTVERDTVDTERYVLYVRTYMYDILLKGGSALQA